MMETAVAYIPMDRRQALAAGRSLPEKTTGAALFADISGFTPLTEAMMKALGPARGPDELTRQINLVYDTLIAEVHRYGGSVLTFSGDAITCWFDDALEPDAALRATACGLGMQQAMRQFAAIDSPAGGTISLGLKVAVAAGLVRRFLLGDPDIHYLDVVAGGTLDRMAEAEHQAERGEVVLCPETAAYLDHQLEVTTWRQVDDAGLPYAVVTGLAEPVPPTPWPALSPGALADQVQPWLLPPVYRHLRGGGQFLADVRPAVALFLNFSGLDYDADGTARDKLDQYIRWAQQTLARYESYLFQLTIGDKGCYLYAAFGAPLTHGDDAARAVAAAHSLRSPPFDFIHDTRIGISQGRVRAGAYGGLTRRTYGVLGDEVNTAARLMGQALPGQIVISPRIAAAVGESYHLADMGAVRLKGKAEPLPIYRVLERRFATSQRPAFTHYQRPLVGRERELRRLRQLLELVEAQEGQVLRLSGPAGVGKSHLSARLVELAIERGFQVALGASHSAGGETVYGPWQHIFRSLFDLADDPLPDETADSWRQRQAAQVAAIIADLNPDWLPRLPLLGELLGLPIPDNATTAAFDPNLRQEALIALVVDMLLQWAAETPSLILLEDVHWLDEASQTLTLALARMIEYSPLALVLVQRPPARGTRPVLADLDELPHFQRLNLSDLAEDGLAELVADRLDGPVSDLALSLIQSRTQGHPFFTEALLDNLNETGQLVQEAGAWMLSAGLVMQLRQANCLERDIDSGDWRLRDGAVLPADLALPGTVHGAVLARFDRLPEAHKVSLKAASAIGDRVEFELLTRAHPQPSRPPPLLNQVRELEARWFLQMDSPPPRLTYAFKHNITREVIYNTLLAEQRQQLHQAIGLALEELHPESVEQLAYHFSRSPLRDKTLNYLDQAARKAQREYANETALNYFTEALALEERWQWRKEQVEVLHILGQREEERVALEALAADSEAPKFEVVYLWGQYYEAVSDYSQAQAALEQALAASLESTNIYDPVRCIEQFGFIAWRQGAYDTAKDLYQQALILLDQHDTPTDDQTFMRIELFNSIGTVYRQQGEYSQASEHYQQALELSRGSENRAGEARTLSNLGVTAYYQRRLAESKRYHEQALAMRRTIGDRAGEGASLYNLALVAQEISAYELAQGYYGQALTIQKAIGNLWEEVNILMGLGILQYELGDLITANAYFQRGIEVASAIDDEIGQAYLLDNLGLIAYDKRELSAAKEYLAKGLAIAEQHNERHLITNILYHFGLVNLDLGHLDQGLKRAQESLDLRCKLDIRLLITGNLATLAAIHLAQDDLAHAVERVEQALLILDECEGVGPEFPHRDYFICYQVLAAAKQQDRAQAALHSAYDLVKNRAKKINDPNLRQSFLEQVAINRKIITEAQKVLGL